MPNGSLLDYLEEEVVMLKSCRFNYKSNDVCKCEMFTASGRALTDVFVIQQVCTSMWFVTQQLFLLHCCKCKCLCILLRK